MNTPYANNSSPQIEPVVVSPQWKALIMRLSKTVASMCSALACSAPVFVVIGMAYVCMSSPSFFTNISNLDGIQDFLLHDDGMTLICLIGDILCPLTYAVYQIRLSNDIMRFVSQPGTCDMRRILRRCRWAMFLSGGVLLSLCNNISLVLDNGRSGALTQATALLPLVIHVALLLVATSPIAAIRGGMDVTKQHCPVAKVSASELLLTLLRYLPFVLLGSVVTFLLFDFMMSLGIWWFGTHVIG